MDKTGSPKVLVEFLTNSAVAWFTAGVIAPIFTLSLKPESLITSSVAILAAFWSLKQAEKLNKHD